jgi:hypothetical protein
MNWIKEIGHKRGAQCAKNTVVRYRPECVRLMIKQPQRALRKPA